jgi:hypothetical protein
LYNWHHKANPLSPYSDGVLPHAGLSHSRFGVRRYSRFEAAVSGLSASVLPDRTKLTTAKREHLNELGSLWPLAALAVPVIYGAVFWR